MSFEPNAEQYEECSEPYAGTESATAALNAFRDELFELRKKHRVANVVFIAEVVCVGGEKPMRMRLRGNAGEVMREMDLLLWAAQECNEATLGLVTQALSQLKEELKADAS